MCNLLKSSIFDLTEYLLNIFFICVFSEQMLKWANNLFADTWG